MKTMKKKTKTLIVTETVRYEFEVSASLPEDEVTLKRFFSQQLDPWIGADFAAVTEREFTFQTSSSSAKVHMDVAAGRPV